MTIVLERVYTVPLRKAKAAPRGKRAKKAAKLLREFVARHMKVKEEQVWIDPELNEYLWERGIEKPPSRVRVVVRKLDDGTVEVKLFGEKPPEEEEEKPEEEEKVEEAKEEEEENSEE